jgi:AcrR family transcriptional regulator
MNQNTDSTQSARSRIMQAAIDIMREIGEVEEVTVRKIAKRAGVGVGLINYHFRSKENLIGEAVQFFQSREVMSGWEGQILFRPKNPNELVKTMVKSFADFMADFPHISRISILNDLHNPGREDNMSQTIQGLTPYIQEALGRNGKNGRAFRTAWVIVSTIQTIFLRAGQFSGFSGDGGFDFFNKSERDAYIDDLVGGYIRN